MGQYEYTLNMNVFLYLRAEKAENLSMMVFRSVELNLVDRFLVYVMVHKLSPVEHDI